MKTGMSTVWTEDLTVPGTRTGLTIIDKCYRHQRFTGGAASLLFAFMKRNVPSIIASHHERPRACCRHAASMLKSLVICLAAGLGLGLNVPVQALEPGKIWGGLLDRFAPGTLPGGVGRGAT
jgi:hypothetical protein